jgi:hypothetical protein
MTLGMILEMIPGNRGDRSEVGSVKWKNRRNGKNIRLALILNPLGFGVNIRTDGRRNLLLKPTFNMARLNSD